MSALDEERLSQRLQSAQAALALLAQGARAEATSALVVAASEPVLARVYGLVLTCSRALAGEVAERPPSSCIRLACPACGVAFLEARLLGFRQLELLSACVHCEASLEELSLFVKSRPYPKDAREVPSAQRLLRLEDELEHVRRLAGLTHPTTTVWERLVGEEALRAGEVERARALLLRSARGGPSLALASLLVAEGKLAEGAEALFGSEDAAERHLAGSARAALGEDARAALLEVAAALGWPARVLERQLRHA